MKKFLSLFMIASLCCGNVHGQQEDVIRNHNLIFNGEVAFSNLYSWLVSAVATGAVNGLLNTSFFESSLIESVYSTKTDNLTVKPMKYYGGTANDLFGDMQFGIKLGYQTYNPGFFNIGAYASAHYRLSQFRVETDKDTQKHRTQRALLGITARFSLGSMEQSTRVIVETGVRYNLALAYKSPMGTDKDQTRSGLSSHYAIMLAGPRYLQDVGIFVDVNHFNMWKDYGFVEKLNHYTVGLTWRVTIPQIKKYSF